MISPWLRSLGARIAFLWWLKGIGTTVFMTLFFWAYFPILNHPANPPVEVPAIAMDHWVRLTPWAYGIYISLWVYVSLPPALCLSFRALMHFGLWVSAMCAVCLVIFWWFPTQTPTLTIDWSLYPGLSFIKGVDAPGNACPPCTWPRPFSPPSGCTACWSDQCATLAALAERPALRGHRLVNHGNAAACGAGRAGRRARGDAVCMGIPAHS